MLQFCAVSGFPGVVRQPRQSSCTKIQSPRQDRPIAAGEAFCRTPFVAESLDPPSLPGPVARFIEGHIHSVLQLEILLLLREHVGEWTPARVASELRFTEQSAELRLVDLSLRGLLSSRPAIRRILMHLALPSSARSSTSSPPAT